MTHSHPNVRRASNLRIKNIGHIKRDWKLKPLSFTYICIFNYAANFSHNDPGFEKFELHSTPSPICLHTVVLNGAQERFYRYTSQSQHITTMSSIQKNTRKFITLFNPLQGNGTYVQRHIFALHNHTSVCIYMYSKHINKLR